MSVPTSRGPGYLPILRCRAQTRMPRPTSPPPLLATRRASRVYSDYQMAMGYHLRRIHFLVDGHQTAFSILANARKDTTHDTTANLYAPSPSGVHHLLRSHAFPWTERMNMRMVSIAEEPAERRAQSTPARPRLSSRRRAAPPTREAAVTPWLPVQPTAWLSSRG